MPEPADGIKYQSAAREMIRHGDDHVPDLFRCKVMEYAGGIKHNSAGCVYSVHPREIIQITCDVFFSFTGRNDFIPGFYDFREVKIVDMTLPVVRCSPGHVETAAEIDDCSLRMCIFSINVYSCARLQNTSLLFPILLRLKYRVQ